MKAILGGALALALVSESAAVAACTAKVVGNDFVIDGCNLVVRNGSGSTSTVNGLGNVIIGYDAPNTVDGFPKGKTGSHNLVVGDEHSYTSSGGVVTGFQNAVAGPSANLSLIHI